MKTFLFAIFNEHTGHWSPPVLFETKEIALHTFKDEILKPESEMHPIKDRLTVYSIGRFDHQSGKISPYLFKKLLIKGSEVTVPVTL